MTTLTFRGDHAVPATTISAYGLTLLARQLFGPRAHITMQATTSNDGENLYLIEIPTSAEELTEGFLQWCRQAHADLISIEGFEGIGPDIKTITGDGELKTATKNHLLAAGTKPGNKLTGADLEQFHRDSAATEINARELWAHQQEVRIRCLDSFDPLLTNALTSAGRAQYWPDRQGAKYSLTECTSWWGRHGAKKQRHNELLMAIEQILDAADEKDASTTILDQICGDVQRTFSHTKGGTSPRGASLDRHIDLVRFVLAMIGVGGIAVINRAGTRPIAPCIESPAGEYNLHAALPLPGQPTTPEAMATIINSGLPLIFVNTADTDPVHLSSAETLRSWGIREIININAIAGEGTTPVGWYPYSEPVFI